MDEGDPAGGSAALADLIDEHGAFLAADFLTEYGIRLVDAVTEWPAGEVLGLVEVLSPTSRFYAHIQGGDRWRDFWGWDRDRHIAVAHLNAYVAAHTPPGKKAWEYPSPGVKPAGSKSFLSLIGRDL